MDSTGLLDSITVSAVWIDQGRKGQNTDAKEHEGRIDYHGGLEKAMESFKLAEENCGKDLTMPILAEYAFLTQELQLCEKDDTQAVSSLTRALADFDDAFLALKAVKKPELYKAVEAAHLHRSPYRYKGMPKDAFHLACIGHKARLTNSLKAIGIFPAEKELLKQRIANMTAAQAAYLKLQEKALKTTRK